MSKKLKSKPKPKLTPELQLSFPFIKQTSDDFTYKCDICNGTFSAGKSGSCCISISSL